jgi:hypothetical protein
MPETASMVSLGTSTMSSIHAANRTTFLGMGLWPCTSTVLYIAWARRLFSARLSRSSCACRDLHSVTWRFRLSDLSSAMAGVGLKPIPLMPSPSSSESSNRWPVISESCHVSDRRSNEKSLVIFSATSLFSGPAGLGGEYGDVLNRGRGDLIARGGRIRLAGGVVSSDLDDPCSVNRNVGNWLALVEEGRGGVLFVVGPEASDALLTTLSQIDRYDS